MSGAREFRLASEAFRQRRILSAIELLWSAESSGYDPDECSALRWQCWMLAGEFENAWNESDRIAMRGRPDPHRFWDGEPFTGKRVIIRCLHGFGDAIQFSRFACLVRREAARVIVQTHPELVSLLRGGEGVDDVISWSEEGSLEWDQQIEVMELPRAFRTTLDTIPCDVPYITVAAEQRKRCRIAPSWGERTRIGLQWGAGNWDCGRSIPLALLDPICRFPEFEYYSFQRGPHRRELDGFEPSAWIRDVSGTCPEIVEAAADLINIDLLITVDTMLAHLAGALGKSAWLLLPWDADWRWMLNRPDTPWYPTMRLFRQPAPGDWRSAVGQMTAELSRFARGASLAAG
jgi:hypothetical protein